MINPLLYTFIAVADYGSFSKAGDHLFISPTAVMKQINSLETHLDLKLVERTPGGVSLTAAGKVVYRDAKFMMDYSKKSIISAKLAEKSYDTTFCVGTSLLNPAKAFMDLWYQLNGDFPDYKLHLVPFEDNHEGIASEIEKLGIKFDFLIGVNDSKTWLSLCNFLPLGKYKKMVAVSRDDPLAKKKLIKLDDLKGRTLMMVQRGDSKVNDSIRDFLNANYPEIIIEDTPKFYDMSVFNRCSETHNVLLTIECWKDVHPGLITIPVDWDYEIPYGLLYSKDAPSDVLKFVDDARNFVSKK